VDQSLTKKKEKRWVQVGQEPFPKEKVTKAKKPKYVGESQLRPKTRTEKSPPHRTMKRPGTERTAFLTAIALQTILAGTTVKTHKSFLQTGESYTRGGGQKKID